MRTCHDCGRWMRRRDQTLLEMPETVQEGGRGLCRTHYRNRLADGTLDEFAPGLRFGVHEAQVITPEQTAAARAGLVDYILARRASGWPADGSLKGLPGLAGLL